MMGGLCLDRDYEKYDIGRLVKTPIWAAHSSDDTNVKIDSDDYYAAELKKTRSRHKIHPLGQIRTHNVRQILQNRKVGRMVSE